MDLPTSGFSTASSLDALCALLNPPGEEEESDHHSTSSNAIFGPGDIGPARKPEQKHREAETAPKEQRNKDIWNEQEVAEGSEFDDILDSRECPEYDIVYKQRVGTEDLFLGMSRKDPSTACCEDMVVRIQLPRTKAKDVSLNVRSKFLDLRTPKYKLGLHLPHPVDGDNGSARFLADKERLEVVLRLKREFDDINFL
ncbi:dynein axonemal assembly factor 6 [Bombina bombina]|uniref:dynein axonemal assembly factor 6 n=1 Tax=Bombina bombina TaxID=8345 RepID=UPI00235AC366|nr:dynein axonemal assembly factor 6 [Bombina bombina]